MLIYKYLYYLSNIYYKLVDKEERKNNNESEILTWLGEWINCLDKIDIKAIISNENVKDIDEDVIHSIFLLASSLSKHENDKINEDEINNFNKIKLFFSNKIIIELIRSSILRWDGYNNPDAIEWQAISRLSKHEPTIFIETQTIDKLIILVNIELKGLTDLDSNDIIWNSKMNPRFRRRLQNLVDILYNSYEKSDYSQNCIINHSMKNILQIIIRLERGSLQELKDVAKLKLEKLSDINIYDNNSIMEMIKNNISISTWTEIVMTKLMKIFIVGLLKVPKCSYIIPLSEACTMLASPCWQLQFISLKFIYAYLDLDTLENQILSIKFENDTRENEEDNIKIKSNKKKDSLTNDKRKSITSKEKVELKKKGVVLNRRSSKSAASEVLTELCRSGFLRILCWTALHSHFLIRDEAGQLFRYIIKTVVLDQTSEFWVSIVEQGLIPLLEIISSGLYLSSNRNTIPFPEVSIRDCAEEILRNLCSVLSNNPNTFQGRIMNALVHTGSNKLRGNIFAGLIYLSSRSDNLGKQLWSIANSQNVNSITSLQTQGGGMFLQLCEVGYKDSSELLTIIKAMSHVVKCSIDRKLLIELQNDESCAQSEIDLMNKITIGPTVLVKNEGQLMKMQCPSLSIVLKHSISLATLLKDSLDEQKENLILTGNYYVWQEIFSHITNDIFLEDNRVNRMSIDDLIESLNIANCYNMRKLTDKYTQLLCKRLTLDTFVPIFKCVLGIGNLMKKKEMKYMFHLSLGYGCLHFLSQNIEKILNSRFPVRVNETIELLHLCLEILFFRNI